MDTDIFTAQPGDNDPSYQEAIERGTPLREAAEADELFNNPGENEIIIQKAMISGWPVEVMVWFNSKAEVEDAEDDFDRYLALKDRVRAALGALADDDVVFLVR